VCKPGTRNTPLTKQSDDMLLPVFPLASLRCSGRLGGPDPQRFIAATSRSPSGREGQTDADGNLGNTLVLRLPWERNRRCPAKHTGICP
jgi:hypothetical protein